MYIEITPTTQLPVFETYLDGNGGTETADGNDNGINTATQHEYLDGNFSPTLGVPEEVVIFWQTHSVDTSIPNDLIYNFPRAKASLVDYYVDGVAQDIEYSFDGNKALVTNTLYHTYEADGAVTRVDGNAPSGVVEGLTVFGQSIDTLATGDTLEAKFVFKFNEFIRLQGNIDTTDYHLHYGPTTLRDETKNLAANIAFVDASFDYTIDTGQLLKKPGILYPGEFKSYTDTSYKVVEIEALIVMKGETVDRVGLNNYRDKYGVTTASQPRLLIVNSTYSDGKNTVYNEEGNIIGSTLDYVTIAYDPNYTGTVNYLYSKATLGDLVETDNTSTVVVEGHSEYQLKGVIMYNNTPYWVVLQYISRDFYAINSMTTITEDLALLRNKELFPSKIFNKELTN